MHVIVLGSAAGGGVPQWNCACFNCNAARVGSDVAPRTQDSLAVTADGRRWFLLNASPDVSRQLAAAPALLPSGKSRRESPIAGVVLTNGDLDHCLGLLSLREWTPFSLYATPETYAGLVEYNAMFRTLRRQEPHAVHRALVLDAYEPLLGPGGESSGLRVCAFSVPGKVPLHLERLASSTPETNVGLSIDEPATGARMVYVPGAGATDGIVDRARGAACLFFDGTFWSEDELAKVGRAAASARALAHLPVGGADGSLELLSGVDVRRRVYTHVNNTNPMLLRGSPERTLVERGGWLIAEDGWELGL